MSVAVSAIFLSRACPKQPVVNSVVNLPYFLESKKYIVLMGGHNNDRIFD